MGTATRFHPVRCSLRDIAGEEYVRSVAAARASLSGEDADAIRRRLEQRVGFLPAAGTRGNLFAFSRRAARAAARRVPGPGADAREQATDACGGYVEVVNALYGRVPWGRPVRLQA